MNKKLLIALLTCSSLLSSCNPTPSETHTPDVTPSETVTEEVSSSTESIEVNSSSEETLEKDDSIFPYESFNMGVGESYNIRHMVKEEYSNAWLDIYVDDISLLQPDAEDNINGLKEGTTHIKLVVEETYYDEFDVNVLDIQEFTKQMKLDKGRLQGKSFTVFGDSISDISVTAYPSNRPTFWCEQLASMFDMTMYNYAISGSTTGYCKGLVDRSPDFAYLVGTWVVRKDEVIKNIAKSDYAFIYFGNNDATYACNIGEFGDVNDENFLTYESFKGSYTYLIDQIRKANPNIKIVCLSLSYSTWGEPKYTRKELCNVVKEIADYKGAKYIDIYDLWNSQTFPTHCPDGIHPQTSGYELILDRILNS